MLTNKKTLNVSFTTKNIVLTSMFSAFTCICTMLIQIPTPTKGYINLGDAMVILSGILLGPVYGALAGGIGSMLADIFTGYFLYAPATFLIKGLAGLFCGILFSLLKNKIPSLITILLAGIVSGLTVTGGYFLYELVLTKSVLTATTGIPGNLIQNLFGIILSNLIYPTLKIIKTNINH